MKAIVILWPHLTELQRKAAEDECAYAGYTTLKWHDLYGYRWGVVR